jgi:hypothetical protein
LVVVLLVAVAELAAKSIHQVTKDLVLAGKAKGKAIGQAHFRTGRTVVQGRGAVNGVLTGLRVKSLPDRPHAVDHSVVKEEDGVVRR